MNLLRPIALTLTLLFALISPCPGLELRLKDRALVADEMVTLGDVAEIPSENGSDGLAELRLFKAPRPGEEQEVSARDVSQALSRRSAEFGNVSWSGASKVTVRREGIVIDQEVLGSILEAFLEERRGFLPRARFGFKDLHYPRSFVLPKGRLSSEVIPSDPRILGSRRFTIIFRIDDQVVENVAVRGEIEAIAPVVVAAADLSRGTLLSEMDLIVAEVDIAELRNPCFDLQELVGKKLKRNLRLGKPVDRSTVEFPPMVRRGELVTVMVRRGRLKLTTRGEALQDGQEGQTIRVRNVSSRRNILCKVTGPGLTVVE